MSFGAGEESEPGRSDSDNDRGTQPIGSASLRLLKSDEAARRLGVHRSTLNRLVQAGAIPVVTYSDAPGATQFFLEDDLVRFVQSRRGVRRRPAPVKSKRQSRPIEAASPWRRSV